jgi:hypothetical protein
LGPAVSLFCASLNHYLNDGLPELPSHFVVPIIGVKDYIEMNNIGVSAIGLAC